MLRLNAENRETVYDLMLSMGQVGVDERPEHLEIVVPPDRDEQEYISSVVNAIGGLALDKEDKS